MNKKVPISLYIHYPFCSSKCPYCDFNSYIIRNIDDKTLIKSYKKELDFYYKLLANRRISTIFFGGGTPSLMSIKLLEEILNQINNTWGIEKNIEISMEVNPTSSEINKFSKYKELGINRISIGIQSLNDKDLIFLGRQHNTIESFKAIEIAQKYFNKKYSIDLIYSRPNQKINNWIEELNKAIVLSPYHISLYQLTIENKTVFAIKNIKPLTNKKSEEIYNITNQILEQNNLLIYEISNYAQKTYECQHNLNYWNSGEWIGIGAGAHGRICFNNEFNENYKIRTEIQNYKKINSWIAQIEKINNGIEIQNNLTKEEFIEEIVLMGLRTIDGISLKDINKYLKLKNIEDLFINKNNLELLKNEKMIEVLNKQIKVKKDYFNILDSIIYKLI